MTDIIKQVAEWQAQTFKQATAASAAEHLRREAMELHDHYWGDNGLPLTYADGTLDERAEEVADIVFMCIQVASCEGFSLMDAVEAKLAKNKKRKWKEPDAQGVVEHEKGTTMTGESKT